MRPEIYRWKELDKLKKQYFLSRSESDISEVINSVSEIINNVKANGDQALIDYTQKFDNIDLNGIPFRVSESEYDEAEKLLSDKIKSSLGYAVDNIRKFHLTQKPASMQFDEIRPGLFAGEKPMPIESAGLYVP